MKSTPPVEMAEKMKLASLFVPCEHCGSTRGGHILGAAGTLCPDESGKFFKGPNQS